VSRRLSREVAFSCYWAVALVLLIAASYALWLPPEWTSTQEYLPVSMSGWLTPFGDWLGRVLLPLVGVAVLLVLSRRARLVRFGWAAISIVLLAAMAVDQHRLQPWAYQTVLYGVVFAAAWKTGPLPLIRGIAVSVYFFSAAGKFDYQFLHTVGQDFLVTAVSAFGGDATDWPISVRLWAAVCFPATEGVIALLLMFPRSRRIGGVMVVGMHFTLIALLSPWGLGHSPGVLTWNAVLAGQAIGLFLLPASGGAVREPKAASTSGTSADPSLSSLQLPRPTTYRLAVVLVAAVWLAPWSERWGWWDHWQSWALYSPHNSRLDLQVHASHRDRLPESLRQSVMEDADGDHWHNVNLGKWSLLVRGVPILPQARYQLGLTIRSAERIEQASGNDAAPLAVRGILKSPSDRWTGRRQEQWLVGTAELREAAEPYWLLPD